MGVDTHVAADVVKEKSKAGRKRFPEPTCGYEMVSEILRSGKPEKLSFGAYTLYLMLADYIGKETKAPYYVFPHMGTLARNMGCDVRSVRRYAEELETACLIQRRKRKNGKQGFIANTFQITTPTDRFVLCPRTDSSAPLRTISSVHKETTRERNQEAREHTPQTPLSGGVRKQEMLSPLAQAILDACHADKQMTVAKAKDMAVELSRSGVTVEIVNALPAYIRANWATYEGPITARQIRNYSGDDCFYENLH